MSEKIRLDITERDNVFYGYGRGGVAAPASGSACPKLAYRVDTRVTKDDLIVQEIYNEGHLLSRWVMNTRDEQIREALIKLGWTAPQNAEVRHGAKDAELD